MNKVQSRILWYSKNWYKTTGDILKDFNIITKDIFGCADWTYEDAVSILLNEFGEDFFAPHLRDIFKYTIFDWMNPEKDVKEKLLRQLISVTSMTERDYFESRMDENDKGLFNLREVE